MINNITVCITTYNRNQYLRFLLEKLTEQTYQNFKVIVVDNANNAALKKEIKEVSKKLDLTVFIEKNQGVVYARNKCLTEFLKTDSQALVWIDDDEWPEHNKWLENLIACQAKTNADVVTSDTISKAEDKSFKFVENALYIQDKSKPDNLKISKFYTGNTLILRNLIEQVGLFDLDFNLTGSEDLDYCVRANKLDFNAYYAKNAKVMEIHPKLRSSLKWFFLRGIRVGQGSTTVNFKHDYLLKALFKTFALFIYRLLDSFKIFIKSILQLNKGLYFAGVFRLGTSLGTLLGLTSYRYKEYKAK